MARVVLKVTVWGGEAAERRVVARMCRDSLAAVSGLVRNMLDDVQDIQGGEPVTAVDLTQCGYARIRREHLELLAALAPPRGPSGRQRAQPPPPEWCTVRRMQEMVAVCRYLNVPAGIMSNVGAHLSSAARIPLLRLQVFAVSSSSSSSSLKHQADLMLVQPGDDCDGVLHDLLRFRGPAWTLDPSMGRNEVRAGGSVHKLRVAACHALRDVLDVALDLGAHQLFDAVSSWAEHNAWMFTDAPVNEEAGEEEQPLEVNIGALAPTTTAMPEHLAALMRFAVGLDDAATQACRTLNSDEYNDTRLYPADTGMAPVRFMKPAVAECDAADDDGRAPRWAVRFVVCDPSDAAEEEEEEEEEAGEEEAEEEDDEEQVDEFEAMLDELQEGEDDYDGSPPPITGVDTLPASPASAKQRRVL